MDTQGGYYEHLNAASFKKKSYDLIWDRKAAGVHERPQKGEEKTTHQGMVVLIRAPSESVRDVQVIMVN